MPMIGRSCNVQSIRCWLTAPKAFWLAVLLLQSQKHVSTSGPEQHYSGKMDTCWTIENAWEGVVMCKLL